MVQVFSQSEFNDVTLGSSRMLSIIQRDYLNRLSSLKHTVVLGQCIGFLRTKLLTSSSTSPTLLGLISISFGNTDSFTQSLFDFTQSLSTTAGVHFNSLRMCRQLHPTSCRRLDTTLCGASSQFFLDVQMLQTPRRDVDLLLAGLDLNSRLSDVPRLFSDSSLNAPILIQVSRTSCASSGWVT